MHDLIIIGGGPAGLTAAIYALRAKLDTLLIEKGVLGGQIALSDVIENYPGFPSISGMALMEKFEEHAKGFGLRVKQAEVESVSAEGDARVIKTSEGEFRAKAVIITTGAKPKIPRSERREEFIGKGVSYCATMRRPVFQGTQGRGRRRRGYGGKRGRVSVETRVQGISHPQKG